MRWADIDLTPTPRKLRQFSGAWLVILTVLAGIQAHASNTTTARVLAITALLVGILGLVKPNTVHWLYVALTILAFPLGWAVSRVLLGLLYYGMITPLAVLFRLLGRDALGIRRRPRESYWESRPVPEEPGSYFRQY